MTSFDSHDLLQVVGVDVAVIDRVSDAVQAVSYTHLTLPTSDLV